MRTETKQIIIEQAVYVADDGTEFDDEDDCRAYEFRLIGKRLKMYDYSSDPCSSVDSCWYVKFDTVEDVMSFIELCKFDGISYRGVDVPGVYMYTEGGYGSGSDAWTNISKIIENIEESEDTVSGN